MDRQHVSDEDLARLAAAQDSRAFAEIIRRFEPMLWAQTVRIAQFQEDDVRDILQETYLRIFEKLRTFNPGIGTLKAWLCAIARSAAYDLLRRNKTRGRAVSQEFEAQLCVNDMRREALRDRIDDSLAVREGLAQIDETSRAAVVMFHIEGLTHEEIATITHQPRGTVQARVFRGRKRLYFLLTADLEAKTYD